MSQPNQPYQQPPWPPTGTTYGGPPPTRQRPARIWGITIALVLAAVAVGGFLIIRGISADDTTNTPPRAGAPAADQSSAPPACQDVFKVGQKIDDAKAEAGCLDPDGNLQGIGSFRCNDGRHLYQVDANTGAAAGWGFGGEMYQAAKDAAADPAYSKAYDTCNTASGTTSEVVRPGAFCPTEGADAITRAGTPMRCIRKTGEARARWRAA